MTTEFLRPEHPEEEDSWSDLAEDLFGIDFTQTPQSGEFVSPEELLAEDAQTLPDSEESSSSALTVETEDTEEIVELERSEEAEESPLSSIEADAKEQETSPSTQDIPEVERTEDEGPTSEPDRSTDKSEKDDTFWDVLDDWNWDGGKAQVRRTDQDFRTPERSPGKRSSVEPEQPVSSRIVREEDDFSSTEDLHEEYVEDSDFGAGLLQEESESVFEPEISDSAEGQAEQTEQAEEPRSKSQRSRRRRRRPRRAKKETSDVETVSEGEGDGDGEVELKEKSSDEEESSDQDDSAEATPRRRSSRRRSSRGRRRRSDSPASEHDSQTPEPTGESDEFGESILDEELNTESEESSEESQDLPSKTKATHRDVPSWEEAISYLLNPSKPTAQSDSKSKTSPAGTATKDSSDSSKPPARRRRRRHR